MTFNQIFTVVFFVFIAVQLLIWLWSFLCWIWRFFSDDNEAPGLQIFGGTLAIDPATVLSVAIVDDTKEGCPFDAELGNFRTEIITEAGRVRANEAAGKALIAYLSQGTESPSYTASALPNE